MDEHRKKIIMSEINYWKQSRMLPEHYCDYLLNLYSEGNSDDKTTEKRKLLPSSLMSMFLFIMLSLSLFLFYFTELSLTLQIVIAIIFGISSLISGIYFISKSDIKLVPMMIASLIFLISTIQMASIFFPDNISILYFVTGANCLLWLFVGYKWTIISFKISGIAGLIIIFITIFI